MSMIRVGVIGCGSIARHRHIPEYAANPYVELVAFADRVVERAQEMVDQYGGKAYQDYNEMLKQEQLDAVSVCTPNVFHAPASIAAAKANVHVLCEKPMATTCTEAEEMIQVAKKNGVQLMIGQNQRLMPPHVKAKQILNNGDLGRILTFRTTFAHGGPEHWSIDGTDSWFFRKEEAFIGALGDLGVHKIDLLSWLLDDSIVEVNALIGTLNKKGDVDDNAMIVARTSKGAIGTITASWTHSPGEDNSTILYCEKGVMRIGTDPVDQVIVERIDGSVERYQVGKIASNEEGGQTNSGVIDSFIDSIRNQTPVIIPGHEGMKALKVVLAALQSADEKRSITISY